MKTRIGFVSNSSTTSFCIYGGDVSEEILDKLYDDKSLEVHSGQEGERYAGISWCRIKDDETGLQFKARVQGLLKEAVGEPVKCRTIEEAYRDG